MSDLSPTFEIVERSLVIEFLNKNKSLEEQYFRVYLGPYILSNFFSKSQLVSSSGLETDKSGEKDVGRGVGTSGTLGRESLRPVLWVILWRFQERGVGCSST